MRRSVAASLLAIAVVTAFTVLMISTISSDESPLICQACENGVVEKTQGQEFAIKLMFKNKGRTRGSWTVNVALEGEAWLWTETPIPLELQPHETKTLVWRGRVPDDAPIDSSARLIAYYDDSFEPLDWWILVIADGELAVIDSKIE